MSESVTLPEKLAFTGPTLTTTVAVISWGAVSSSFWQPGMHLASTAGSLSPAQTLSCGAGTSWLSFICMGVLPRVIYAVNASSRQRPSERESAVGEMDLPGGERALVR